jgi:hypothetical protein
VFRADYADSYRIAWLIEPPATRPDIYERAKQYRENFNLVLTHQIDFIKEISNGIWVSQPHELDQRWGLPPPRKDKEYFDDCFEQMPN